MKQALFASFFSRGWSSALSLLAVPLYLKFIGVEAYGVVGVFTSLSAVVGFLDLGLGITLTREMTRLPAGQIQPRDARHTARTFELSYSVMALFVGGFGGGLAYFLGMDWVSVTALSHYDVAQALLLAAVSLACQWPGNLYAAGLVGLHRQMYLGVAVSVLGTLRVVLTLILVWRWHSLTAFFSAQIAASLLQTWVLRSLFWSVLGRDVVAPRFQWHILRASFGFAGGMTGIALTTLVLTQTDKLILSRTLNLSEFGVYTVANTLASGLYMVISPFFSVAYPRFSELVHQGRKQELAVQYQVASQLIAVLIVPLATLLIAYKQDVLFLWTGDRGLGSMGAWTLAFLVIGNVCNGLMNMPYALQLAYGWPRLAFWVNVGSIVLLVPGIWWAANRYGATGGAAAWAILNFCYVIVTPQIMHRRLLPDEKAYWYGMGVILPVMVCVGFLGAFKLIPLTMFSRVESVMVLGVFLCVMVGTLILILPQARHRVFAWLASQNRNEMCD